MLTQMLHRADRRNYFEFFERNGSFQFQIPEPVSTFQNLRKAGLQGIP
jgi:hypothetical protein